MNPQRNTNNRLSRFLCKVLRHTPESIGITIDTQGWTDIDTLITKVAEHGHRGFNRTILDQIVATDDKGRYEIDDSGKHIRCCHGHSVAIDISSNKADPPAILYHGTAETFVPSILKSGLISKSRQYVHLSTDIETAKTVGARHEHKGRPPVVFEVAAAKMAEEGHEFFLSHDGVWLTKSVPAEFLTRLD